MRIAHASFAVLVVALTVAASVEHRRDETRRSARGIESLQEREHEREAENAPDENAFWAWRVSYPTGRFDPAWYASAAKQDQRLPKGLPRATRAKAAGGVLDPQRVTALGPAPLDWADGYGLVAGRVNVIATHPTQPNVAWFASDGGGVWKTTTCCGGATTWTPKTDAPQIANLAISALVLDPGDPDTLYAGTGDPLRNRPFAFGASGVLKSSDGGETWRVLGADVFNPAYAQPAGEFPQRRSIGAIAVDPRAGNRVVVGTSQGLYFSYDAGESWAGPCFTNGFTDQRQDTMALLALDAGGSTRVIAAIGSNTATSSSVRYDLGNNGANGVYAATMPESGCPSSWSLLSRSNNGWPANTGNGIAASAGGNSLGRIDLAVAPSDHRVLYAQVYKLGVWRSADSGATWTKTAAQPDAFATGCHQDSYDDGMGAQDYNSGLTVSPTDPQVVFLSSTDLWRSTDGGRHFVNLTCGYGRLASGPAGYVHVDHHARAFVAGDPQRLLIGSDGGMYASTNALGAVPAFTPINSGANTIEFYSGDLTARFDDASVATRGIAAGAQDNGSSVHVWGAGVQPGLASWRVAQGGDGVYSKIEPVLGQRWYHEYQFGFIAASTSGPDAEPVEQVSPGDTQALWNGDRLGFLMPYELYKFDNDPTCAGASGCQRMIAGTDRVWESTTGGIPSSSWRPSSPDLTKALSGDSNLSILNTVAFAYGDPSIALAGSNDGNVWFGFDLGGDDAHPALWVDVTGGNAKLPNRPVMSVATDPTTPTTAYAALAGFAANTPGTPGHLYKVTCAARCASFAWEDKSGDLPDIPVNAILVNPNLPRQVFAGTDWGLYFTDDISAAQPRWSRFDAGLPSAMIWGLTIDRGATTLAIFTRSRGAYVWPLPKSAAPAFDPDQRGITGSWYDASKSGQGFEIEVYPDLNADGSGLLFGGWFTYDVSAAGGRRWYVLSGNVLRNTPSATLDILTVTGGNFDAPPTRSAGPPIGAATIRFDDCAHAALSYTFTDGSTRAGTIALTRLIPNGECVPGGNAGAASSAAFSGSWYDPATRGQGLIFDFSPSIHFVFAAWYTYAKNGAQIEGGASQRWYTLQSDRFTDGSRAVADIPIYETTGGEFDRSTSTTSVQVGTAAVTLLNCSAMNLSYRFTSGDNAGLSDTIELQRTGPAPGNCP